MSRSNPTNNLSNPCTRWHEWDGENGQVRYYDKEAKKQVKVDDGFTYLVLDVLSVIKGWHDPSQSGITSNEIRDTRSDPFVVRSFKGGVLAEGIYADIKDRVNSIGGNFTTNCYIAFKDGSEFKLGSIQFKGAALGAWMEFQKANRAAIFKKAVRIKGYTEGQKGRITYRMPKFHIVDVSDEAAQEAEALDRNELQPYLSAYLKRPSSSGPSDALDVEPEEEPYNVDDAFTRGQAKLRAEREAFEAQEARNRRGGIDPDDDIDMTPRNARQADPDFEDETDPDKLPF